MRWRFKALSAYWIVAQNPPRNGNLALKPGLSVGKALLRVGVWRPLLEGGSHSWVKVALGVLPIAPP